MEITRTGSKLTVKAPAKLNLFLEVLGKRDDGFHEIESVMQTVTLFDEITFERVDSGVRFSTSSRDVPADETNLVARSAELLRAHVGTQVGAVIELTKNIPVGAGLGGGSSDAAATLVALNRLWQTDLPREELHKLAERLGSDVPFFLYGGTALCRGRGERVEPIADVPGGTYVVVYPRIRISTRGVYEKLPPNLTKGSPETKLSLDTLIGGEGTGLCVPFFNRLQTVAVELHSELEPLRQTMKESGLKNVIMTGSGSAFFGTVTDQEEAGRIAEELTRQDVGEVFVVESTH